METDLDAEAADWWKCLEPLSTGPAEPQSVSLHCKHLLTSSVHEL